MMEPYVNMPLVILDQMIHFPRLLSACYSVFTTRIILNIRSAGQRDQVGDLVALHVDWDDDESLLPMVFRPADAIREIESMVSYHV